MNRLLSVLSLLACAVTAAASGGRQDEKVVPVHQEPRHHLVFDGPDVRILDIQIPPGDTTLFHTHSDPVLYVNMSVSQTRGQVLGREWSGGEAAAAAGAGSGAGARTAPAAPAGSAAASSPPRPGRMNSVTTYSQQPLTHRVNNIGQNIFRLIGVINRSPGDEIATSSESFAAKPEVENPWFRGYRWTLTSELTAEHRHPNPVVIILVGGRAAAAGSSKASLDKPGAFAFFDANAPHRLQAVGADAEIVEIEVRRPSPR